LIDVRKGELSKFIDRKTVDIHNK